MVRNKKTDNFIDKTFTVVADILIKIFPASKEEKQAFFYYRDGMSAQADGDYAEALENYYEALQLEEDPYDRSYILYNIGLIYQNNGEFIAALEFYHQAILLNSNLPQALNNLATVYHYQAIKAIEKEEFEIGNTLLDKAGLYWRKAIKLAPNNYIEAQNWLKTTGRANEFT